LIGVVALLISASTVESVVPSYKKKDNIQFIFLDLQIAILTNLEFFDDKA
jgi:hypothetical protein